MNRKIIVLGAMICSLGVFASQQEQPKPEQVSQAEQKADKQEEVLRGTLRIISGISSVKRRREEFSSFTQNTLVSHYGDLDDNDPLIQADYSSPDCPNWTRNAHPKIKTEVGYPIMSIFTQDELPVLKPIAYTPAHPATIQQEIAESWLLPRGISSLISEYAAVKVSLLDLTSGSQIELELPTRPTNKTYKALLTCLGYNDNYAIIIRKSLISAHENGEIVLEQSLLDRIKAELVGLQKNATKEFEQWSREYDERWEKERQRLEAERRKNEPPQNSCIVS